MLLAAAITVTGMYWIILGPQRIEFALQPLIFSFIAGNCTVVLMKVGSSVYTGKGSPRDWLYFLALLIPVTLAGSWLASVVSRLASGPGGASPLRFVWDDMRFCVFFSLVIGVSLFQPQKLRRRLEQRNRELENQVMLGQIERRRRKRRSGPRTRYRRICCREKFRR